MYQLLKIPDIREKHFNFSAALGETDYLDLMLLHQPFNDFSGKTILPFNVHNGSRFSNTISTMQSLEPNAAVIEDGFTVSEHDVAEAGADVVEWLKDLGY